MTSLSLNLGGALLSAAVAGDPADDRVREGIIVPWNEDGRTNLGKAPVRRGAFTAPAGAKMVGIYGHNREASVSRLLMAEDRPEGLWGRFRIGRTQLGDQLLAEIDDGVRDGLSVEASDLVFDADGGIVSGTVDFFAHVPVGAYSSARVATLAASLTTTGESTVTQTAPPPPADGQAPAPVLDAAGLQTLIAQLQAAGIGPAAPTDLQASASLGLTTAGLPAAPAGDGGPAADPLRKLAQLQAGVFSGREGDPQLVAALADITNAGLPMFQQPAGAIGEKLWEGGGYTRRFVPLMRQKELTSWKFKSWQWVNRPVVAAYAGNKAEIPTNTVSVEEFENTATRVAGGWDIDRKFLDFGDEEFWLEFYAAQTESYLEVTDLQAAAALVSYARDISVDLNVPAGYVDSNVAQADVLRAVALGTAIMEDTPRVRRGPDWVLMNTQDWLKLMDLTNLDLPAFLSLLKVKPENFERTSEVPAGAVVMGVTQASTFRELGGGAPIRVQALDVAHAGVDSAVYGYTGKSHDRPGGIISVPLIPEA